MSDDGGNTGDKAAPIAAGPVPPLGGTVGGFELTAAPAASCSCGEFARRHSVSGPAVGKWILRGLPALKGADGVWAIDPVAGDAWLAEYRRAHKHGGVRGGGGRKSEKRKTKSENEDGGAGESVQAGSLHHNEGDSDYEQEQRLANLKAVAFLEEVSPNDPAFIAKAFTHGLTTGQVDRIKALLETQKKGVDLAQQRGELVSVEEGEREVLRLVRGARSVLEALPLRAAEKAVNAAGADIALVPVLAAAIEEQVREAMGKMGSV